MIKNISIRKLFTTSLTYRHFNPRLVTRPSSLLYPRHSFAFSSDRMPRNKEEAWMMQQQKAMGSSPQSEQDQKTYSGVTKVSVIGFAILFGALIYIVYVADVKNKQQLDYFEEEIKGLTEVKDKQSEVGGDWTLVNSDGQPFSSRMLSGYYYLVYFGYTKCPDMTPNTLFYISSMYRIIRNLPEGAYLKLKIIFVSIDPQRDRPEVLKNYLNNFSKNIIGVTGSTANDIELKECMNKFKIHQKRVSNVKGLQQGSYLIDHTRRVFLMDPDNVYLYHVDLDASEQQSAKAVLAKIIQNQNRKQKIQNQIAGA